MTSAPTKSHSLAGRWRSSTSARRELALERERAIREAARVLRVHVIPALDDCGVQIASALRGEDYIDLKLFRALALFVERITPARARTITLFQFGPGDREDCAGANAGSQETSEQADAVAMGKGHSDGDHVPSALVEYGP